MKDPLNEFRRTMDVLNGYADYFVVLLKGESVKGMESYISLLLKEPCVDKVVALMEQGALQISDERLEVLLGASDREICISFRR